VKLDLRGLEQVAKSAEVHAAVDALADVVAENARAMGIRVIGEPGEIALPVEVHKGETTSNMRVNRALAAVTLNHASGLAAQGKHGVLTNAASAAGLKLKGD
jgi:hypothetical protein